MKKILLFTALIVVLLGCQKKHPVRVFVDPSMREGGVEKIAVMPFASALHHSEDPGGEAPKMMDQLFLDALDAREDYMFSAPTSVRYAIDREGMAQAAERFIDDWREKQEINSDFLDWTRDKLHVDAVMVGVVDLWQKDEVDIEENATPTTYVGATITIIDADNGSILFQASDEDFQEGARSETTGRNPIRSGSGKIYRDPGANLYKAPDYKFVAIKVATALVSSIPVR